MAVRDKSSRWTVGSAGVVMIVTAGFHAAGYRPLVEQLAASNIQAAWLAGVKGLWLVFSLHLVIVGSLFLLAGIRPGCVGKTVLLIAGLVPVGDAIVLFSFVGIFCRYGGPGSRRALALLGGSAATDVRRYAHSMRWP